MRTLTFAKVGVVIGIAFVVAVLAYPYLAPCGAAFAANGTCPNEDTRVFLSAITVNEDGNDADTRVEGDTDLNLVYVDASNDRVGVSNPAPSVKFHVSATGTALQATNRTDAASNLVAVFESDRATPAANDEGYIPFRLSDSAGNQDDFARMRWFGADVTSTSEDGRLDWGVVTAGSFAYELSLLGADLSPTTSDGLALGTGSLMWSDLFLASGSVINFNNGDVTLTHGSNLLTLAGGDLALGSNNVTGSFTATGATVTFSGGTNSTSASTGTIVLSGSGGIGLGGNVNATGYVQAGNYVGAGDPSAIATTGALRLANNAYMFATRAAGGADRQVIGLDSSDRVALGQGGIPVIVTDGNVIVAARASDPSTVTTSANLYALTATTTEMWVQDAAGNRTQISPHQDGRWVFRSCNNFTGRCVAVDMEAALSALEVLTGQKLLYETWTGDVADWTAEEARKAASRAVDVTAWESLDPDERAGKPRPAGYFIVPEPDWVKADRSRNPKLQR